MKYLPLILFAFSYLLCRGLCNKCKISEMFQNSIASTWLAKMDGERYETMDLSKKYTYYMGICVPGIKEDGMTTIYSDAGIVQVATETKIHKVVGRLNATHIRWGSNWMLLEYAEGDNYTSHCDKVARRAQIFITCQGAASEATFRVLHENTDDSSAGCYYLFELEHPSFCMTTTSKFLIFFASAIPIILLVLLVYFVLGLLFNRIVRRRTGWRSCPNQQSWIDFGNRMADICDMVCRCRKSSGVAAYNVFANRMEAEVISLSQNNPRLGDPNSIPPDSFGASLEFSSNAAKGGRDRLSISADDFDDTLIHP